MFSIVSRLRARAESVRSEIAAIRDEAADAVETKRGRIDALEQELHDINEIVVGLPRNGYDVSKGVRSNG